MPAPDLSPRPVPETCAMTILDDPQYHFELTRRHETWTPGRELAFSDQLSSFRDQPVRMMEIGSFEGASAVWLLQNVLTHPDSELHSVDCQEDDRVSIFRSNVQLTGRANQVNVHQIDSKDLCRHFEDDSFDFIYVDAAHDAPSVLRDVMSAYSLCKRGGIVGCDDYLLPRLIQGSRPVEAIDAFTNIFRDKIEVTWSRYQLWFRKLA